MADFRRRGAGNGRRAPGHWGAIIGAGVLLGLSCVVASPVLAQPVGGSTPYDGELFSLTNQDRTSNGEGALADNGTLAAIAESSPYYGCSPSPIYGRAADMLTRQYFSHVIPGCSADGGYVWAIMSADGVHWSSAGENVGWNSGYSDPAANVNAQFMGSSPHRANILGAYNELGVGSWYWTGPWTGAGGSYSDVYMFAQEFAQVGSSAPPPPPPPPPPAPSSGGSGGSGSAPSGSAPSPTPAPTPTPKPKPPPPGVGSRPPRLARGLLSST
ncbi:MAG: hypothetical protein WA724_09660, partial [Candidatus Dormiibacterota bacterium]